MLSKLNSTGYFVVPSGLVISIVAEYRPAAASELTSGMALMVVIPSANDFSTLSQGAEVVKVKLSALELISNVFAAMLATP
jgi:hypothetical protein